MFVLWTADISRVMNCEIWNGLTHDGASCVIVRVRLCVFVCGGVRVCVRACACGMRNAATELLDKMPA
jgi:hypothetical protein